MKTLSVLRALLFAAPLHAAEKQNAPALAGRAVDGFAHRELDPPAGQSAN